MPKLPQSRHLNREARRVQNEDVTGWKVLVVDDQPDNITVVQLALHFHGADVRTAQNGVQGLKILESFMPTLIILDLSMPEMTGWEMLEKLKADAKFDKIPVIALTAHAMDGDKESVLEAGFTGYIPKPFSVISIISDIKDILINQNNTEEV